MTGCRREHCSRRTRPTRPTVSSTDPLYGFALSHRRHRKPATGLLRLHCSPRPRPQETSSPPAGPRTADTAILLKPRRSVCQCARSVRRCCIPLACGPFSIHAIHGLGSSDLPAACDVLLACVRATRDARAHPALEVTHTDCRVRRAQGPEAPRASQDPASLGETKLATRIRFNSSSRSLSDGPGSELS